MAPISGKYHFTGIGGVGMSPLARLVLGMGASVGGSDRAFDQGHSLPVIQKLMTLGADLVGQDGQGIDPETTAMVVSTAIENDNPEVVRANDLNIPLIHRARLLADLAADHQVVAVAGTAGKTTVTGMLGWVLDALGADPCVVNGGAILNWVSDSEPGSVHLPEGSNGPWVLEVDESDKSFLNFFPDSAIITNVSEDHFSLSEVEALFETFRGQVRGALIEGEAEWGACQIDATPSRTGSVFTYKGVQYDLNVPGLHNARNAFTVIRLCEELGYDAIDAQAPLAAFQGIERRLEKVSINSCVSVYDDYAHNPAKIAAACETLIPYAKRLHCLWRPHGFGPLKLMSEDLCRTWSSILRDDDQVYILPVYYAGGTVSPEIDSPEFVSMLKNAGINAHLCDDHDSAHDAITSQLSDGDSVVCMGARDPGLPGLARRIAHSAG